MRTLLVLLAAFLLFLPAPRACAGVAAIHADALPQETAVLAALDDVRQIEPFCSAWAPDWKFPVPKKDIVDRLEKDLGFLNLALKSHPDNTELLLLAGLVAHYAYNLDVPQTHDQAMSAFDRVRQSAPTDLRGQWFQASLQCQTNETQPGADAFLAIESAHAWDQLPIAFWDDYMACASVTNMPAHVLRASSYLDRLHAPASPQHAFLADIAHKRFDPFDPAKAYEPRDVWQGASAGPETQFTSTACGVRLQAHRDWTVNQLAFSNGSCVAYFGTGTYKAITRNLRPSILMLVQQPKPGESLQDFSKKFLKGGTFEPFTPSRCPSSACIAMKGLQPEMYKVDGDGQAHIVVFERDQPDFPGLLFESPSVPPKSDAAEGPKFFHPSQTLQRIPGKLYYIVLIDMAASIEEPAMKDFDFFLQNLAVE